ncbi:hypothetical protein ABW51_00870 [Haemophilus sp. C1]|uniref:ATP-binding protein n=1 Tax=Haemophilus TaxID=724 RepID=UPI0006AB924F|nr:MULTISPECIES: ATP-binding protein [Haemophilus]KOQ98477.1 hypothetical protein ABW51_00870 [Haemophilus sp. C1]
MNKQIIVLFGSSGRGKTTTLKKLIEELKTKSEFLFMGYVDEYNDSRVDVIALFKHQESDTIIGISTAGDIQSIIKKRIGSILIEKYKCKIIFTASRTKGKTCYELDSLAEKHNYSLNWIEKLYRTYDPIKNLIGVKNNSHLDNITKIEVKYLLDYLSNYTLK